MDYSYIFSLKDRFSGPIKRIGANLSAGNKQLLSFSQGVAGVQGRLGGLNRVVPSLGGALAGAFAGFSIAQVGLGVKDTLGEFERMEAVLTNTLGSNSLAKGVMQDIKQFAEETPFEVNELTDSWVRLANQGFRPNMKEMKALGDLASSTGKDMMMLSEAIIDAQVGEFERLKEFGIRASKDGNKITFAFKGQQTVVENNERAIQEYLLSLGKLEGVQGASAAIMSTTEGKASNLADAVTQLKLRIGEELRPQIHAMYDGLITWVKGMQQSVTWVKANWSVVMAWGKAILYTTGAIVGLWAVAKTILVFKTIFAEIATAVGLFSSALKIARAGMLMLNLAMMANPIGLVILGIAGLVAGMVLLYKRFEWIRNGVASIGKAFRMVFRNIFPGLDTFIFGLKGRFAGVFGWMQKKFEWIRDGFRSVFGEAEKQDKSNKPKPARQPSVVLPGANPWQYGLPFGVVDLPGTKMSAKGNPYGMAAPKPTNTKVDGLGVNQGLGASVGAKGGEIKHITINIQALNQGGITVQTTTMDMSIQKIRAELERMLLSVVNDVNYG